MIIIKNDNYHNYNKIIQQIERENISLQALQGQIKHFSYKHFYVISLGHDTENQTIN